MSNDPNSEVKYSPSENMYENTVLIIKRAKQIMLQRKSDFDADIEKFEAEGEHLVSVFHDTSYRERIAKKYERLPKPVVVAIKDVEEGNIMYSYPKKTSMDWLG